MKTLHYTTTKMRNWYGSHSAAARKAGLVPRQWRRVRQAKNPAKLTANLMIAHYKISFLQKILHELRTNGHVHDWHISNAIKRINRS